MEAKQPDPTILRLENDALRLEIAPEIGGRVTSIYNKGLGLEFLWRNERVRLHRSLPGDAYDPVFFGGIDEVIPGDLPERIDALDCPDHGELWTLPLNYRPIDGALELWGTLPRWGLRYLKRIRLRAGPAGDPAQSWIDCDYRIENPTTAPRTFLWKLHAALAIEPGDEITCPAGTAAVADPHWSRWGDAPPFAWPLIHGQRADHIPPLDGTTDFLFLYDLAAGQMGLLRSTRHAEFRLAFDTQVFPYACLFASYGGLDGYYTAVLEPCTAMPVSVNQALAKGQCSLLAPGAALETRVSIYAGRAQVNR